MCTLFFSVRDLFQFIFESKLAVRLLAGKSNVARSLIAGIITSVFVYFLIDNVWWVYVFDGLVIIDVFPE